MKSFGTVALALIAGCHASAIEPEQSFERPHRVLEISVSYYMPPGSVNQYVLHDVRGRLEVYALDSRSPETRTPLMGEPALARFIDRVDSLITHRVPGDTIRPDALNWLCGDGYSHAARLTVGSTVRTVLTRSCGDNSPGSGARTIVLRGILDSLAALPRAR